MNVETITLATKPQFIDICMLIHSQSELQHLPISRDKVDLLADRCMYNTQWFGRVAVDDGAVVGAMCGYVQPLIYSDVMLGVEEGIYVMPHAVNRGKIAKSLLLEFVAWCRGHGVADIRTGVISNIDNLAADVLYRYNGFKRIGTIYALKEPGGV